MERQPNTQYVLSVSYGKDSLACLGAIEKLGWPLDRIVHAEVWATKDIPADLPPMVEFKSKADSIIKERYGIDVEHVCATKTIKSSQNVQVEREREREREREPRRRQIPLCFEDMFYHKTERGKYIGTIKGWPKNSRGQWCKHLKTDGEADIRRFILQSQPREEIKKCQEDKRFPNEDGTMVQQRSQDAAAEARVFN